MGAAVQNGMERMASTMQQRRCNAARAAPSGGLPVVLQGMLPSGRVVGGLHLAHHACGLLASGADDLQGKAVAVAAAWW